VFKALGIFVAAVVIVMALSFVGLGLHSIITGTRIISPLGGFGK